MEVDKDILEDNLRDTRIKYSDELLSNGELKEEINTISNTNSIPVIVYGEEKLKASYSKGQSPLESTVNLYELASTLGYVVTYDAKENTITLEDPKCGIVSSDVIVLENAYDEETGEFSLNNEGISNDTYGTLPKPDRN